MDALESMRSRIKFLEETVELLKDYNKDLKQWNAELRDYIDDLKSGHFCCLETNCSNRVVQRIRRIRYGR